jgi:hypothetical protein
VFHCAAVKIKKPIKTKFRLPVFNWVALKPNQINGTVFNEIDDERILEVGNPPLAPTCMHFTLGTTIKAMMVYRSSNNV